MFTYSLRRVVTACIFLLGCFPYANSAEPSDNEQNMRFSNMISSLAREQCEEISYSERRSARPTADVWDVRCVNGTEYRLIVSRSPGHSDNVFPCAPDATANLGADCFRRQVLLQEMPGSKELLSAHAWDLIVGRWLSKDRSRPLVPIEISPGFVSMGQNCKNRPARLFDDRVLMSVERRSFVSASGAKFDYDVNVRTLAISFDGDNDCGANASINGNILLFPVTSIGFFEGTDASCNLLVSVFANRDDFDASRNVAEVLLNNENCKLRETQSH